MEEKYPGMTGELKRFKGNNMKLFLHKATDYGPQNIAVWTTVAKPTGNTIIFDGYLVYE